MLTDDGNLLQGGKNYPEEPENQGQVLSTSPKLPEAFKKALQDIRSAIKLLRQELR